MTLLIINGNIPCCDCKCDTGIRSDARNLFNENEVYCHSCSSALLSEVEDDDDVTLVDIEPDTVRMPPPYPFPYAIHAVEIREVPVDPLVIVHY